MSYALWNPTAYYLIDDEVIHLGSLYRAIADNFDSEPPSVNWILVPPIGGVNSVVAGTNVTITGTPNNPVINATIPPNIVETLTVGTNLVNVGTATNPIVDVSISSTLDMFNNVIDQCSQLNIVDGNINMTSVFVGNRQEIVGCKALRSDIDSGIDIQAKGTVNGIRFYVNDFERARITQSGIMEFLQAPPRTSFLPSVNADITNKQYVDSKVFTPIVGSFSSSTTQLQTGGIASTATPITYDTTEYATSGVSIVNNSEIKVTKTGVYKFSYSVQLDKSGGGISVCDIWIRINGNNVARSASQVVVAGTNGETFPFCEYILPLNANDYVEVMFLSADATMAVTFFPASGTAPNDVPIIPSILANIIQIS